MSFKLLNAPRSCSSVVQLCLEKCGAKYELIPKPQSAEELERVSPMRQVPILYLPDGSSVSESAAMILHLDDLFPGTLLPKRGDPARAQGYRWLLFAVANTHETILRWFYTDRYTTGDPAPVRAAAGERLQKLFGIIASNAFPDNGPYVLGKEPSAVDWHVLMTTEWLEKTGLRDGILEACPKIAKLVDLVHEDEVVRKVWVEHGFLKE